MITQFIFKNKQVLKSNFLLIILFQSILICSCKKEDVKYELDDFIQAGQKNGLGIEYTDLTPDINCTIIDPWEKTDTILFLDLNKDGMDDFSITGTMCHPSMLGGDCEDLSIIPLCKNEICIDPETQWLDTIPGSDTIGINNNWTNNEALIYSYYWEIGENATTLGHWKNVSANNKYYIGYKIIKDEKTLFGWIGMNRDTTSWSFNFLLTDYAILMEYVK